MDKISIERKYILEYIKDTFNDARISSKNITLAKFITVQVTTMLLQY